MTTKGRRWTKEEDRYLLAHYGNTEKDFLAEVLGRSRDAVKKRHSLLNKENKQEQEHGKQETEFFMSRANRAKPKRLRKSGENIKGTEKTSKLSNWTGKGSPYAHTKSGFRSDLGMTVRSGWEANVLRVLKSFDIGFEFEPRVFAYPIKRGNKAYIPDVRLIDTKEWIEVKGYLDKNSKIKLKRFKKYYPEEFASLIMIISKSSKAAREFCQELEVPVVLYYEHISKVFKDSIKTWEGR
jgi:hypothetical protein